MLCRACAGRHSGYEDEIRLQYPGGLPEDTGEKSLAE
jgi:hypothetical protein